MQEFTGFVGPSYTLSSVSADCQRCLNMYPEVNEIGAGKERRVARFVQIPGTKLVATAAAGPVRGAFTSGTGRVFFVCGNTLYELEAANTLTSRGTLDSSTGRVEMADNGVHLVVVTGGTGYALQLSNNSFTAITDPDFPKAQAVAFIDNYLIVDDPVTGNFQISQLADAVNWDGLDVANPEGYPDKLVTLLADHRELFLFNEQTTEVWFDSGDFLFPFARNGNAFIEVGIIGAGAKAKLDSGVAFWGKDRNGYGMAFRIIGYNPQRISTHAVEEAVRSYGDISGATCYTYQQNGHTFWATNFPNAKVTWVFDIATGLWHERQSSGDRHRAENHCFDGSRNLVGDYANGKIYELDPNTYTDNGNPIVRQRRAPHISDSNKRLSHYAFQLDMEPGVGLQDGQGSDPQVVLRYSDDGGHTWSNELWRTLGKVGEYKTQAVWRRLGQARDRVYEVTCSEPVKVCMLGAFYEIEGGDN